MSYLKTMLILMLLWHNIICRDLEGFVISHSMVGHYFGNSVVIIHDEENCPS